MDDDYILEGFKKYKKDNNLDHNDLKKFLDLNHDENDEIRSLLKNYYIISLNIDELNKNKDFNISQEINIETNDLLKDFILEFELNSIKYSLDEIVLDKSKMLIIFRKYAQNNFLNENDLMNFINQFIFSKKIIKQQFLKFYQIEFLTQNNNLHSAFNLIKEIICYLIINYNINSNNTNCILEFFKKYKNNQNLKTCDLKKFISTGVNFEEQNKIINCLINLSTLNDTGKKFLQDINNKYLNNKYVNSATSCQKENLLKDIKNFIIDETYFGLNKEIDAANNIKKYSVNITYKIDSDIKLGSAVIYKADKENNILYLLTNRHVVYDSDVKNAELEFINFEIEIKKPNNFLYYKNGLDIALIVLKLESHELSKIETPEIYTGYIDPEKKLILSGDTLGSSRFDPGSTNVCFGMGFRHIKGFENCNIGFRLNSFPGNSGSGIFIENSNNNEPELFGILSSSDLLIEKYTNQLRYPRSGMANTYGISIKEASEIAYKLISVFKKENPSFFHNKNKENISNNICSASISDIQGFQYFSK